MTNPAADAAKLLPFDKTIERLREYSRPDRDSGIYPMMLEVEEVRALLAGIDTSPQAAPQEAQWPCPKCGGTNYQHKSDCPRQARAQSTDVQPAPPAGEPDFKNLYDQLFQRALKETNGAPLSPFIVREAYRLGLAARPKVKDAEVVRMTFDLRRPRSSELEKRAADLLERLAVELSDAYRNKEIITAFFNTAAARAEALAAKLSDREAELANSDEMLVFTCGLGEVEAPDCYADIIRDARKRHAARQQQKASAEPTERNEE